MEVIKIADMMIIDNKIRCVCLLVLAILLLVCLAPMPYGFYNLVRFVSFVAFAWMAFDYYKSKEESLSILFGILCLLFQPFAKIALGRTLWNIVDVIVALGLCFLCWKTFKKEV